MEVVRMEKNKNIKHVTFAITQDANKIANEQSQLLGITKTKFIVDKATDLNPPDSSRLNDIPMPKRTTEYIKQAKEYLSTIKPLTEKEKNTMNKKNGASTKTSQIHLRVTKDVHDSILSKAKEMSMSASDYITFVTTRFDLEEVSLKMDRILELFKEHIDHVDDMVS